MNYNISKPSAFLSQYVKYYWKLESSLPNGHEHIQRIVPSGLFELIFYMNDKPVSSDNKKPITDNTTVTGQMVDFHDLKVSGNLSLFSIYFHPHGLSIFLDLPMKEIFNQSVPLRYILKDRVNKFEDELSSAITFQDQISIAENFLLSNILNNEKKYQYDRISCAINRINETKGILDIDALASETCLSRKQFERTFTDIIGASPKQFLKIIRFQNVIWEKSKDTNQSLTNLAYKCGYYDQAHMIKDFKTMSGTTPRKYFENCDAFSDYFD